MVGKLLIFLDVFILEKCCLYGYSLLLYVDVIVEFKVIFLIFIGMVGVSL